MIKGTESLNQSQELVNIIRIKAWKAKDNYRNKHKNNSRQKNLIDTTGTRVIVKKINTNNNRVNNNIFRKDLKIRRRSLKITLKRV